MEKELIGPESTRKLEKQNILLLVLGIAWLLLIGGWIAIVFLFQTRTYEYLWIVIGSLVTTLFVTVFLYVLFKASIPLWAMLRFAHKAAKKDHVINDVVVVSLDPELETYKGILVHSITVREIDEGTVWKIRYEAEAGVLIEAGKHYAVETYDEVLLRIREKE